MPNLAAISLLAPGLLTGAALTALPIAAHLIRRKARRRVVFPSVTHLLAASASRPSVFRFQRPLLLLLRCLAVVMLATAFAQPYWRSADAQGAGRNGQAVVFLIDRSASTGQLVDGVTALTRLKAAALKQIDALTPGGDAANVVYADARPTTAFVAVTPNPQAVRQAIAVIEPAFDRADLTAALALAGRELRKHDGPKRLVIVSDLQASNWADVRDKPDADTLLPPGVAVTVVPPAGPAPVNLTLQNPSARPASPRTGRPEYLTVRVVNHAPTVQLTTVHADADGRPLRPQTVTLDPGQAQDLTFKTRFNEPGEHKVIFSLPADALDTDNTCYQVVHAVTQTPVAVICDDGFDQPGSSGFYLSRALAPHGDDRDRCRVTELTSTDAWPGLHGAAAVFIADTGALRDEQAKRLNLYLQRGGVVVFFCGDGPVPDNLNAIQGQRPKSARPWTPTHPRTIHRGQPALTISAGDWGSNPLKRFGVSAQTALSRVRFSRAWNLQPAPDGTTLLRYHDGTPAMLQTTIGAGRLLVVNFGVNEQHSDFAKHGLFVALLQAIADNALDQRTPSPIHTVAQPAHFQTAKPIRPGGPPPTVTGPDGQRALEADFIIADGSSTITLPSPDAPGFYTARQGHTALATAAVNLDPREGELARLAEDSIIAALTPKTPDADTHTANATPTPPTQGRALWAYLLLGASAMLGLEMWLLGYAKQ